MYFFLLFFCKEYFSLRFNSIVSFFFFFFLQCFEVFLPCVLKCWKIYARVCSTYSTFKLFATMTSHSIDLPQNFPIWSCDCEQGLGGWKDIESGRPLVISIVSTLNFIRKIQWDLKLQRCKAKKFADRLNNNLQYFNKIKDWICSHLALESWVSFTSHYSSAIIAFIDDSNFWLSE